MYDTDPTLNGNTGTVTMDARELERINRKLDLITAAVAQMDRRREELEEIVADLLPLANGALGMAARQLHEWEESGSIAVAAETLSALEAASRRVDPDDLRALGDNADAAVGTLRRLTSPEMNELAGRTLDAVQSGRTGPPPSMWSLLRRMRKPHVRRGMAAALEVLTVLGEGSHPATGVPEPRQAAPRPTPRPVSRPAVTAGPRSNGRPTTAAPLTPSTTGTLQVNGTALALDADGCLVNPDDWSPDVAQALAAQVGIELGDRHWKVLNYCREQAGSTGAAPGLRQITKGLEMSPKEMYTLFPGGPGILAARLAGLGKPKSCV